MIENSYIELSKSALKNNLSFINKQLGSKAEFVSVIKGNAYGHGIEHFVPLLVDCGVKSFAVFSAWEAKEVLEVCPDFGRLIIMGNISDEQLDWAIAHDMEVFVFDIERLQNVVISALKNKKKAKIHLEIETGLNRTGFESKQLSEVVKIISSNTESLILEGLCTHLSGAENIANYYRINQQIKSFNEQHDWLKDQGITPNNVHIACSAAIINYPEVIHDMARIGIMQYGFWPSKEVKMGFCVRHNDMKDPLKRVITWKSRIMSIKHVKIGEYIGYGSSLMAEKDMVIATVPVGYSDGFSRSLSNQGKVLIRGQRLDVVGIVNMNMVTIDVTNIPDPQRNEEVVLIGTQGDHTITVASFSDLSTQLNYELLTRLPDDIPRKIVD